ncbi:MAG: hypothetical protein ACTHLE_08615 [Agriterribacter sp.]
MKRNIIFFVAGLLILTACKKDKDENLKLDTYREVRLGGWDGLYGSGLDADNGVVYGYGSLSGATKFVDVFFDRSAFFSYDADGSQLPDVGTRFASTEFSVKQFEDMVDDKLILPITPAPTADSVQFDIDDVVLFQTKWGKKGLIRIISMTSPTGDLVCDLKVQER